MTGRERVLAALNFEDTALVPVDFNAHRSSGIAAPTYQRLREYLGLPPSKLYVYDLIQQLALVEGDVLDHFRVDTFQLGCDFHRDPDYWKPWQLADGTPCMIPACIDVRARPTGYVIYNRHGTPVGIQKPGCLYYEQTRFPLAADFNKEDFSDLDRIQEDVMWCCVPSPPMPIPYAAKKGRKRLREVAARTRGNTDRAIYAIFGGNLVENGQFAFRIDNFLRELLANPRRIHKYLDAVLQRHMTNLKHYLDAVGDLIDVIGFGDDMGTQNGPQFSVAVYEEFFKPRHQRMFQYVHERFPELKICLHCCGGVRPLLQPLAEAGLNAVNPVQFNCRDMDLPSLKEEFKGKLAFWGGGCDTRTVLPKATPEQVAAEVRANVAVMKPGGGFVFQQVHNILSGVPPENIEAMFEAVRGL